MKVRKITNLLKNVYLIDGSMFDYEVFKHGIYLKDENGQSDFIEGNWKLLGKLKDLTEELCEPLVVMTWISDNPDFCKFKNYVNNGNGSKSTAKESFQSALEAKGLHLNGNPIPKEIGFAGNVSEIEVEFMLQKQKIKWQEAEQNVFSENTLIFIEQ